MKMEQGVISGKTVRECLSEELIFELNEIRKQTLLLSEGRIFLVVGRESIKARDKNML